MCIQNKTVIWYIAYVHARKCVLVKKNNELFKLIINIHNYAN